jgi:DNA mismatch repair ATPase MutS
VTREEIKQKYHNAHTRFSAEENELAVKIRNYGLFRIGFFILWIVFIFLSTSWSWSSFGSIMVIGALVFGWLVTTHARMHNRKQVLEQLVKINMEQEKAMDWDFALIDDGSDYADSTHLFSYDLDLFGPGSLFQYLNRTSTAPGRNRLAELISRIERSPGEIQKRQKAVGELADMIEWRQQYRVYGLLVDENPDDVSGLVKWVNSEPDFKHILFHFLIIFFPILNLLMLTASVFGYISFWQFLAYLIIPLGFAGIKHRKVNVKHNLLGRKYQVLKKYSRLFSMIESHGFTSNRMTELSSALKHEKAGAAKAIRQLAKITNAFDTRLNLLAGFLMNIFFLWDIRQSIRLERWQQKYKEHMASWFEAMAETDACISLAGYAYNNPDYVFPDVIDGDDLSFEAIQIGHPLIHADKRVCNDYLVDGWGSFTILTGANMAGKSTFLRTIGVNMVLASCGAPVCARSLTLSPVELVTSIHTIDSLANNESYFYAELKRLKLIIDMLQSGKKVFIILDEILKGTNSKDKQAGSKALVKQLISLQAGGIIATHDLSLGDLESTFPEHVKNRCFEIIIEKDKLEYNYLLKEGIARNMNATILMEKMGITEV